MCFEIIIATIFAFVFGLMAVAVPGGFVPLKAGPPARNTAGTGAAT